MKTTDTKPKKYMLTLEVISEEQLGKPIDATLFEYVFSDDFPGAITKMKIKEVKNARNKHKNA